MKRTGAILLSMMLIFTLTVTNLAGAYHTAGRVYAAEETDGGAENSEGGTQGGEGAASTNDVLPTEDTSGSGNPSKQVTQPQEPVPSNTGDPAITQPQGSIPSPQDVNLQQGINPQPGNLSAQDVIPSQPDSSLTQQENNSQATIFTVTFDANGHGVAPAPVTVESGQTVAKPDDLTADGFTFTGWFRDAAATAAWNFDADTITDNITLYAGWTENAPQTQQNTMQQPDDTLQQSQNSGNGENGSVAALQNTPTPATTYTVTFDANGHGTAPDAVTVNEGDTISEPVAPTEDGWTFTGWFLDREATIAWDFNNDTVTDHTTLYAGWEENTPAPTRSGMLRNSGTKSEIPPTKITINIEVISQSGSDGDWRVGDKGRATVTVTPENASKDVSWVPYMQEDYVEIDNNGNFTIIAQHASEYKDIWIYAESKVDYDIVAYANAGRLAPAHETYSVSVTNDGNGSVYANPTSGTQGTEVTLTATPNSGYKFDKWVVVEANGGTLSVETDNPAIFTIGNGNAEIKATFTENYSVKVNTDGDGRVSANPTSGKPGTEVTLTATNKNTGYKFYKWVVVEANGGSLSSETDNPATFTIGNGNAEITAMFKKPPNKITITIDVVSQSGSDGDWRVGDKGKAIVTVEPEDACKDVRWQIASSTSEYVEIDEDGNFTVIKQHDKQTVIYAQIYAFSQVDNYYYGYTSIRLTTDPGYFSGVEAVELLGCPNADGYWRVGDEGQASVRWKTGVTPKTVTWSAYNDEDIGVEIGSDGKFRVTKNEWYAGQGLRGTITATVNVDGVDYNHTVIIWIYKDSRHVHSVKLIKPPKKLSYKAGELFDYTGMEVELTYQDGTTGLSTDGEGFYYRPGKNNALRAQNSAFAEGDNVAVITYTPYYGTSGSSIRIDIEISSQQQTYTVDVTNDGNGSGMADPTSGIQGTEVTLSASPNSGFMFERWEVVSGDVTISNNKFTIGTSNVEVKAIFEPIPANTYSVTVTDDGNGSGAASPAYGAQDEEVTLTATPNSGYQFKEWRVVTGGGGTLSDTTANPATFTIGNENATVQATFRQITLSSIAVTTEPTKKIYAAGEKFNRAGMVVTATYSDGSSAPVTRYDYTPTGPLAAGVSTIAISYTEGGVTRTTIQEITVHKTYSVSVTNDGNGTGTANPTSGIPGTEVTLSATPNSGFAFKRWEVVSGDVTVSNNRFTIGDAAVEVRAVFEQIPVGTYSVTVTNDGNGSGTASPTSGAEGTSVTLTATPNNGYEFDQWVVDTSGNGSLSGVNDNTAIFTIGDGSAKIKATFKKIYSVTVNTDGNGTASAIPTEATAGTIITVTATPNNDYEIDTITYQPEGGNETNITSTKSFTMPAKNVSVTVKFKPVTVTGISIDTPGKTDYEVNEMLDVSGMKIRVEKSDGTHEIIPVTAGMVSGFDSTTATQSKTLTITYEGQQTTYTIRVSDNTPTTYSITLDANGGKVNGKSMDTATTGTDGKLTSLPGAADMSPPDANKQFVGWFTATSGGTAVDTSTVFASNDTIYAIWQDNTPAQQTYTITLDANGGTVNGKPTDTATTGTDGKLTSLPGAGNMSHPDTNKQFVGWFTATSGGTQVDTSTVFKGNDAIFAQWKDTSQPLATYTITLNANGGTVNGKTTDDVTTGTDGKLSTLPTPSHTNSNMSFLGWYTAASGGTAVNTSTVFTGNDTIYAQWKDTTKPPVTYTITFNPNGGTVTPTSGTTDANGKLATLPTPTHSNSNMQFIGWFTAKTGGTQVNTSTVFRSNSTIYAQWKDNTPTTQIRTVTTGLTGGVPGTKFTTKEQVEDELLLRVGVNRTTANGRWASYDVKLQVYINGQWIDADKSNFPSGGLTVTLPYPSGTGRNTHTFKVAHMFTVAMNGHQPGQVETPPVTNTDKGIQVTLQGLSPVVITWEEKQGGNPSNPGGGGSSGGSSGSGTYMPAPVPQIKPNFDSKYYADTYPDLKEAFGYDHDALWNHYVLFGKNEGRKVRFVLNINKFQEGIFNYADRWQMDDVMLRKKVPASAYFDTDAYADLYPDLKAAFGYDHELLYRHYLEYGRYEGRKVYMRNIFNAKAYADRYADLKKAYGYDKVALWRHYQIFGKVERRYVEWLEDEGQKD